MTAEELRAFKKSPITFRDEIWTRAAEHIITAHKPNLLLFHLLTTDCVAAHATARAASAARRRSSLADAKVARLVRGVPSRPASSRRRRSSIVSDHGFQTYKRRIRPNVLMKAKGLDTIRVGDSRRRHRDGLRDARGRQGEDDRRDEGDCSPAPKASRRC